MAEKPGSDAGVTIGGLWASGIDGVLDALITRLEPGDIVIDCGTSGGVFGRERGYCLMIGGEANYVRFRLSPDVNITICASVKRAGDTMVSEPAAFTVVHHPDGDEMEAYERLLGDAMAGEPTLFASEHGVEAAWAIVQPILGNVTPIHSYESGSWGPPEAERLAANVGGWHTPAS